MTDDPKKDDPITDDQTTDELLITKDQTTDELTTENEQTDEMPSEDEQAKIRSDETPTEDEPTEQLVAETQDEDPFAEFDEERTSSAVPEDNSTPSAGNYSNDHGNGSFSDNLMTKKISTRNRTFFLDLKKSVNGKFLKISEKSRGKKSTIMMDAEDIPGFIDAMNEIRGAL